MLWKKAQINGRAKEGSFCIKPIILASFGLYLLLTAVAAPVLAQDVAQVAPAEEQVGVFQVFEDWAVVCGTYPATDEHMSEAFCELRQDLVSDQPGQPTISLAMQVTSRGLEIPVSIVLPFGLLVSYPVTIELAMARLAEFPFRTCMRRGCIAAGVMQRFDLDKLAQSESAELAIMDPTLGPARIQISVVGLKAAWRHARGSLGIVLENSSGTEADIAGSSVASQEEQRGPVPEAATVDQLPPRPYTQIGLFRIKDNARIALSQIEREGMWGEIRSLRIKNADFWRVLVGPARTVDENERFLRRSRALGFIDAYHVEK